MQEMPRQIKMDFLDSVYRTENCQVYQLDASRSFNICLFGTELELKLCGLYAFYKKIRGVNLSELFSAESGGVELIYLSQCDRLFVFDLDQILELREFLEGTFVMLQLNSVIHESTSRRLV